MGRQTPSDVQFSQAAKTISDCVLVQAAPPTNQTGGFGLLAQPLLIAISLSSERNNAIF